MFCAWPTNSVIDPHKGLHQYVSWKSGLYNQALTETDVIRSPLDPAVSNPVAHHVRTYFLDFVHSVLTLTTAVVSKTHLLCTMTNSSKSLALWTCGSMACRDTNRVPIKTYQCLPRIASRKGTIW